MSTIKYSCLKTNNTPYKVKPSFGAFQEGINIYFRKQKVPNILNFHLLIEKNSTSS
jgi:hypothetical protein